MRSKSKQHSTENESMRDRWMLSYADLVTLLLALFIVMFAASDKERAKMIAQSFSAESIGGSGIFPGVETPGKKDETERVLLQKPVIVQKAKVEQTERGLVVSLKEAGLFAPGDAAVGADAAEVIAELAETLKESSFPVRVEGHTDAIPIATARYASNWDLSTARASNVLQKLIENGIAPERLSASGYGGFQPVADNSTAEGRAQNRRVDVVVLNR